MTSVEQTSSSHTLPASSSSDSSAKTRSHLSSRFPDVSWPFPSDLNELNGLLHKVYKGFHAQPLDESFLCAASDEKRLIQTMNSKGGQGYCKDEKMSNLRIHRRAYVYQARKILERIRFDQHQSFFLVDLGRVAYKLRQWHHELPMIRPYYAVKCNPNPGVLHVVAALGAGFDCASREELHTVAHTLALAKKHQETSKSDMPSIRTSLPHKNSSRSSFQGSTFSKESQDEDGKGGSDESKLLDEMLKDPAFKKEISERIIFTHSIKELSHIEYARSIGVKMTVADNETELKKIHKFWPEAFVLLRIVADDRNSSSKFSVKFGATKNQIRTCLLPLARKLGIQLIGVSFHAGSLSKDISAFQKAISDARLVFDWAREFGFHLHILDVGGGWPESAEWEVRFEEFAAGVRSAIDQHFFSDGAYDKETLHLVAEPGRYMVGETHALVTSIFGFRDTTAGESQGSDQGDYRDTIMKKLDHYQYYINDGLFGGLNKYKEEKMPLLVHSVKLTENEDAMINFAARGEAPAKFKQTKQDLSHQSSSEKAKDQDTQQVCDGESEYHREDLFISSIFGPTCEGTDAPAHNALLPKMSIGDSFVFVDVGAYTIASASHFNGFSDDRLLYVFTSDSADPSVLQFHEQASKQNA